MIQKIIIAVLVTVVLLFFTGCTKKTSEPIPIEKQPETQTAVNEIDDVGAGIDDISNIDEELNTSELDDLDSILKDIENI